MALIRETDWGQALLSERSRAWSGWGWECAKTSAPLSLPPQAPRASTPTLPVTGMSWKPFGPPGLARRFLVWCWQCLVAGWRQQAGVLSQVVHLKYSTPPKERCGLLA